MILQYHGIGLRELQEAPGFSEKSLKILQNFPRNHPVENNKYD